VNAPYPNPFNSATTIPYQLAANVSATLKPQVAKFRLYSTDHMKQDITRLYGMQPINQQEYILPNFELRFFKDENIVVGGVEYI
jgi:hypothetical protein